MNKLENFLQNVSIETKNEYLRFLIESDNPNTVEERLIIVKESIDEFCRPMIRKRGE